MDELKALHLKAGDWWRVGALIFVVWVIIASLQGISIFALIAVPLLVGFWLYAILLIDHWVRRHD
jgi:hypothetical protein